MAKKKLKNEIEDDSDILVSSIRKKYGNIVQSGIEVLDSLETYEVISISPALDLALGGGFREGTCVNMTGDPKTGKDQPLSSIVYTPYGPKTMGSLKIGDLVCTPDGGSAKINGIYPQGLKDVYRVTFNDGTFAECGIDHLWKVCKNYHGRNDEWVVLPLRQIMEEGLFYSDRAKWKIPICEPVDFDCKNLEIDPYILGCLIGDGGLSQGTPIITTSDTEILEAFIDYAKNNGLEIHHKSRYDYSIVGYEKNVNNLTNKLRALNLMGKNSHTKFIPQDYLYSCVNDRFELIRGLMDTDGYNDNGKSAEYSTVSYSLSIDVAELLRSLGYMVKTKERMTKCGGREFKSYRLYISGNDVNKLFKLERKIYHSKRKKPKLFKTIKKIELIRKEETQCIYIDHRDHLYLTDGFNVTHNTTTALYFAAKAQKAGKRVFYYNTEGRLTTQNFTGIKGLDASKIQIVQTSDKEPQISAEKYLNSLETLIKHEPGVVVIVDSVSNMLPQDELDGEIRSGVRNGLPRLLSMFFKRISGDVARMKSIVIFITHNIANTSGARYAPAKMADCGNMLQFQVSTNMVITHRGRWEVPKESGNHVGQIANWKIITSAAGGTPNTTAESWIRYGVGIDESQELAQIATQFALISCKGAWYSISELVNSKNEPEVSQWLSNNGVDAENDEAVEKAFKFQGMENLVNFLTANPDLESFLMKRVRQLLL